MGGFRARAASVLVLLATACAAPREPAAASATTTAKSAAADARAARVEAALKAGRTAALERRWSDAEAWLRQAVNNAYGFGAPWATYRADALSQLARCFLAEGRPAEARAAVDEAALLLRSGELDADQRLCELETTRAEAFLQEQQPALAVVAFEAAAQAATRHAALGPIQVAISLRLAETLEALGRRQDAKKTLERTLSVARRPEVGPDLARSFARALATLYDASGEPEKAHALRAELAPGEVPTVNEPVASTPAAASTDTANTANNANNATEIAAMQADFRACYRVANQNHADVAGRVALVLSVAADGHVTDVKAEASGLPVSAVACLKRRASLARFEPPHGGSAVITVPVTFVKQEND